jgi:deazaflavin-dependent oxidoreductase (nitroreductase family)
MGFGVKLLMAGNIFIYRLSRGRVGDRLASQSILLLNTTGRRSGKTFTTPLNYYRDGEDFILVASNWGNEHNPGWFYNLINQEEAVVQVKDRPITVHASVIEGEDYERLWQLVTEKNAFYKKYQSKTRRRIPLVRLASKERDDGELHL